jgi:ribosome biogenesis GTPase A
MPTINWYPGHIAKAERKLKELANLVDVVVLLIDARIPESSFYEDVEDLIGEKPRLLLINKADLAQPDTTDRWKQHFEQKNNAVLISNCTTNKDINNIIKACYNLGKPKIEKLMAKGRLPRAVRLMIMGMPNVGKSSLINRLVKTSKTKVGPKAGVTRTIQWVRINPKVELLDTPGIIPMKLQDQQRAQNLAIVDSVGENAYDTEEIAKELLAILWKDHKNLLKTYYNLEEVENEPGLKDVARARNLIKAGNEPDILRCAQRILSDFRTGKIGRITLEHPPGPKITTVNQF